MFSLLNTQIFTTRIGTRIDRNIFFAKQSKYYFQYLFWEEVIFYSNRGYNPPKEEEFII